MSYDTRGAAPDYLPCRYGASRLTFRGPRRRLEGEYIAVLGGTETYGKFIEAPYPQLMEHALAQPVVNFGCLNASIDAFASDAVILDAANGARAVVLQIMGAQNMSNRLYTVHPRRNDRFLNASALLKAVYREVDFTEFHFTGHMLATLKSIDAKRFDMVREELKQAWLARMRFLLAQINRPVFLLWFADYMPPDAEVVEDQDPLFIDKDMIAQIAPKSAGMITSVSSEDARDEGVSRMWFDPMDLAAAKEQLSVLAHEETAKTVSEVLQALSKRGVR